MSGLGKIISWLNHYKYFDVIIISVKKLKTKFPADTQEYYTLFLIIFGLPLIAFMWSGIKLAITIFIIINIILGILALRS